MKEKHLHIIYLGCSGFPFGLAEIERQKLISKSLVLAGAEVIIINRKGTHSENLIPPSGTYEGISYIYTSGSVLRHRNLFIRNFSKLKGFFYEFYFIFKENRKTKVDAAIVSNMSFFELLYYRFISKLLNFKIILNYVEYSSAVKMPLKYQINNFLYDRFAVRISQIIFPISDFLISRIQLNSSKKPFLKIPSICDFEKFTMVKQKIDEPYFLFCGAAVYWEVILFVIRAFNLIQNNNYCLYLIINGQSQSKQIIFDEINKSKKHHLIKTHSELSYSDLVNYYINARGMLIPLRPTLQDKARFPHKVAEYTASKNPIITTCYGEMPNYFKDEENALIANSFDEIEFSKKMLYVINNPEKAVKIGLQGYATGYKEFNYTIYGDKIINIINAYKGSKY